MVRQRAGVPPQLFGPARGAYRRCCSGQCARVPPLLFGPARGAYRRCCLGPVRGGTAAAVQASARGVPPLLFGPARGAARGYRRCCLGPVRGGTAAAVRASARGVPPLLFGPAPSPVMPVHDRVEDLQHTFGCFVHRRYAGRRCLVIPATSSRVFRSHALRDKAGCVCPSVPTPPKFSMWHCYQLHALCAVTAQRQARSLPTVAEHSLCLGMSRQQEDVPGAKVQACLAGSCGLQEMCGDGAAGSGAGSLHDTVAQMCNPDNPQLYSAESENGHGSHAGASNCMHSPVCAKQAFSSHMRSQHG
eukprot:366519-Chlamydomonas_euryale.AAC.28